MRELERTAAGGGGLSRGRAVAGLCLLLVAACGVRQPPASPVAATPAPTPHEPLYAAVIDAGSSGSRIHLFEWRPAAGDALPRVDPAPHPRSPGESAWEAKSEPGISAFAGDPDGVATVLEPLIRFAVERIGGATPALAGGEPRPRFPLYLKATAGVRLLAEPERRAVLEAARRYLETTPFRLAGVDVLSGAEEGLYGWISVNYTLGYLGRGGPFPSIGALDLGGASTQITFAPLDLPREHGAALRLGGTTYHVYSKSYLGLGQDEARESLATPACYPVGYPIPGGGAGEGDYDRCRAGLVEALAAPCAEPPCSLMGAYQPPLYGDWFAFSAYTYAARFFDLGPGLDLDRMEAAGRAYCAREWPEIETALADRLDDPYVPRHCFTAAWVVTLLHDGFGFPMDGRRITVAPSVQGNEVGWALGALVYELANTAAD